MTDKEIINSFENCYLFCGCSECSYAKKGSDDCLEELKSDILALINRQQAEIERLKDTLNATIAGQETLQQYIATAKSEAVKEFAKFLIDKSEKGVIYISDLPDYVKEVG